MRKLIFILMSSLSVMSCYDGVEYNSGANSTQEHAIDSVSSVSTAAGMLITAQQQLIDSREHKYQYQFNLHIDNYCGYLCLPHNFSGRIKSTFVVNDNFASGPKANMAWVSQVTVPVMTSAKRLNAEPLGAIANILFSYEAHMMANIHGPFPYDDYKILKTDHPLIYQPLDTIYNAILADLEEDVEILERYKGNLSEEMQRTISGMDIMAGGKIENWIKFANSLRLRMAMNLVNLPDYREKAQRIAEDAVSKGVLEVNDMNIGIDLYNLYNKQQHPLYKISAGWVDTRLNANLYLIAMRTGNPIVEKFFDKNSSAIVDISGNTTLEANQDYASMRAGSITEDQSQSPAYISFSRLSQNFMTQKLMAFKVSEVCFLRAEGALRGWNMGGQAKDFYEAGIRESFKEFGFDGVDNYLSSEQVADIDYVDYYNSYENNTEGVTNIPNKWIENGTKEENLEQIITQKWLALFPMSVVAWTDIRRTGYPKLIPNAPESEADGDGSIDPKIGIRRLPYSKEGDQDVISEIQETGIPALGGPDQQGTRLWWDTGEPNF